MFQKSQQNVRDLMVMSMTWANLYINNSWFLSPPFASGITKELIVPLHMPLVVSAKMRRNSSLNEQLGIPYTLVMCSGQPLVSKFNSRNKTTKKKCSPLDCDLPMQEEFAPPYTSLDLA